MRFVKLLLGLTLLLCMSIQAEPLWQVDFESPTYQEGLLVGQEDWTVATGDNLQTVTTAYSSVTAPEGNQFVYADALAVTYSPVFGDAFATVDTTSQYLRLSYYMLSNGEFNNNFGFYDASGASLFFVNADSTTDTNTNTNLISMPWNGNGKIGDFIEGQWTKISVDIDALNLPWVAIGATVNDTNTTTFTAPFSVATTPVKLRLRPYGGVPAISYTCYDDIKIEAVPSFRVKGSPSSMTFIDGSTLTKQLELTTQFESLSYEATLSTEESWITLSETDVTISSAPTTLNVTVDSTGLVLPVTGKIQVSGENGMIEVEVNITIPSEPFGDDPIPLPGTIEVEDYDKGGPGVAYYDTTPENWGGQYRLEEAVDIETCSEGGFNTGWNESGEWLLYTCDVDSETYDIHFRVSAPNDGPQLRLLLDYEEICVIDIPSTAGWQNWQTVTVPKIAIEGGDNKVVRLEIVSGGVNINSIEFEKVEPVIPDAPSPNPMTWASEPAVVDNSFIIMEATTATHTNGVEYFFEETTGNPGGISSEWQLGTAFTNQGLQAGYTYTYRVKARGADLNHYETEYSATASASLRGPFSGTPLPIPGMIECEDYDVGGEGIAYHDTTIANLGGQYRLEEGVDIEICNEGGYEIGFIETSEWMGYTVAPASGTYEIRVRVGSPNDTGQLRLTLGTNELCIVDIPNTGDWHAFTTLTITGIEIPENSSDDLRIEIVTGGFNMNWVEFVKKDLDAPTPNPMEWTQKPIRMVNGSVSMECVEATHVSGVEYYFEETTGNPGSTNSGWQASRTFVTGGLLEGYTYVYRVQARNLSVSKNETLWSGTAEAIGDNIGINLASDDAPMGTQAFANVAMWTDAAGATGSDLALNATDGTVICGWASSGIWGAGGELTPEDSLYFGYLEDDDAVSVTISGLQTWLARVGYHAYELRLYRNAEEGGYFTDVNIISAETIIDVVPFPSNIVVRAEGEDVIRAVNDSSRLAADTISIAPQVGDYPLTRATISGVQILAVPEPALFGLLGMISLLLLRRR